MLSEERIYNFVPQGAGEKQSKFKNSLTDYKSAAH